MKKIEVTLGDLREAWYAMECPTNFNDFVQDYEEDPEYDVINTWICSENCIDDEWDDIEKKLSIDYL